MINCMILNLKLFYHFLMEMLLATRYMVYTFRNLFVLREYDLTLVTSKIGTNFYFLSYKNKVIDTINFVKIYPNIITDTQI